MIDATISKERRILDDFLAPSLSGASAIAFMPRFSEGHTSQSDGRRIGYRGGLFADGDVRALLSLQQLCGQTAPPTRVSVRYDTDFESETAAGGGGFVVGSNTNDATAKLISGSNASNQFEFEFGESWAIDWADGDRYELPDPSTLDSGEYRSIPDFGVLARATLSRTGSRLFLVAGLGSRATAAASHFLLNKWRDLAADFNGADFAVLFGCGVGSALHDYEVLKAHRMA